MRSLRMLFVHLVVLGLIISVASAQSASPAAGAVAVASPSSTKEVEKLREEVASQEQTIQRLQAAVEQLLKANIPKSEELSAKLADPAAHESANSMKVAAKVATITSRRPPSYSRRVRSTDFSSANRETA